MTADDNGNPVPDGCQCKHLSYQLITYDKLYLTIDIDTRELAVAHYG